MKFFKLVECGRKDIKPNQPHVVIAGDSFDMTGAERKQLTNYENTHNMEYGFIGGAGQLAAFDLYNLLKK